MSHGSNWRGRRRRGEYAAAAFAIYKYVFAINGGADRSAAIDAAIAAWRTLRPHDEEAEARRKVELMLRLHLAADETGTPVWRDERSVYGRGASRIATSPRLPGRA